MSLVHDTFSVDGPGLNRMIDSIRDVVESLHEVGPLVKVVRKRVGWSQEQVANHISIPINRLGAVEAGKASPSVDDALAMLLWIKGIAPIQDSIPFQTFRVLDEDENAAVNQDYGDTHP